MKLVYEDEYGAYLGVTPDFLKNFIPVEINSNFEVYDSLDGLNRFIVVKSSRIPDDEDLITGRFGIDFNRARPTLKEALQYGAELPRGYRWLGDIAFAAKNKKEYNRKSAVWDNFYSYIWDTIPQTVWVAPHSGTVNRVPDDVIAFPKLMIDNNTAGVAALCAFNNGDTAVKRIMVAVHSTGQLGAVLNLGDFGILNEKKMETAAKKIERKYHDRAQSLAVEFKQDFYDKTLKILEQINRIRGTLNPEELNNISGDDSFTVGLYVKCLGLYGQEVRAFTLSGFKEALDKLSAIEVPVISHNYLYTGRNVGKLLKLSEKIGNGRLHSAVLIECARLYTAKDPELVTNIILDLINELFTDD